MLVHSGSLNGGHYYCFLKPDAESDQWFKFNDNIVTEINKDAALNVGMGGYSSRFKLN
jgi:ubiquitin carboxyl-terminal hydrolase 7